MRDSRRMKRMERTNRKGQITGLGLNLIPMMDVLTVLVFFLLFHSFNGDMPEAKITLPDSVVETKPRETVHIVVTPEVVMVQGEAVVRTPELQNDSSGMVQEVIERLRQLEPHLPKTGAENREVTLLADKTIEFKVLKKIMSTCTASGYGRISLAVVQKAAKRS
jgi:biopolymer transport protein TolR